MSRQPDLDMWQTVAQSLAAGSTKSQAARDAGCSAKHVHGLLKHQGFLRVLEEARKHQAKPGGISADDMRAAGEYLRRIVDGEEEADRGRIVAAKAILQYGRAAHTSAQGKKIKDGPSMATESEETAPDLTAEEAAERWRVVG